MTVPSVRQLVLSAALRRQLGFGTDGQLELLEEADGLRLLRPVAMPELSQLAGMVTAPSRGATRRLKDFDPALVSKAQDGGPHE